MGGVIVGRSSTFKEELRGSVLAMTRCTVARDTHVILVVGHDLGEDLRRMGRLFF